MLSFKGVSLRIALSAISFLPVQDKKGCRYYRGKKGATFAIFSEGVRVGEVSVNAEDGYNEATFGLSFSKSGKRDYKKANKDTEIKAAKNGVYYLPKGTYTVKSGDATQTFSIE